MSIKINDERGLSMNRFVVILKEKRQGELDSLLLAKHIEHLRQLNRAGKLLIAGPFKNNEEGLLILSCEDIDEAISIVENDPFIIEKYYHTYDINEFTVANEDNNWLMDNQQTLGNLVH
jgi:uncharacterized protein